MPRLMKKLSPMFALLLAITLLMACQPEQPEEKEPDRPITHVDDEPFMQETSDEYLRADTEGYLTGVPQAPNHFYSLTVNNSQVFAAADSGVLSFNGVNWNHLLTSQPFYCLQVDENGQLYAGGENTIVAIASNQATYQTVPGAGRVRAMAIRNGKIYVGAEHGLFIGDQNGFKEHYSAFDNHIVNDLVYEDGKGLWVATNRGLYLVGSERVVRYTTDQYLTNNNVQGLSLNEQGELWIATTSGLNVRKADGAIVSYTDAQGMPVTGCKAIIQSTQEIGKGIWVATVHGILRLLDGKWNYYAGRRWLSDDLVNDLAVDSLGNIWAATDNGLVNLRFRNWTLSEKAQHYQEINDARHNRYGLVAECQLDLPGDLSTYRAIDSDNDGLWTGMALAAMCFRYAATGDEQAKASADEYFNALAMLEEVTGTSGLPARSVAELYAKSADPSCTPYCQWRANEELGYDWKSDTGSEEILGHFYAYALYYDLVAKGEQRKKVIELAWRIADRILSDNYFLIDYDDEPTSTGIWNPDYLWKWYRETELKQKTWAMGKIYAQSLEILAIMRTAYHITGDPQFLNAYNDLIGRHALDDLILTAALYFFDFTDQSTDELLFMAYYPLLLYEQDPAVHGRYLDSLRRTWQFNRIEQSSFFNITFGALTGGDEDFDLPAAIDNLQNIPLDLIGWYMENSHRKDVSIFALPNREGNVISDINRPPLPPDERRVMKWNGDPFVLDDGGPGTVEEAGTFWLLPYWMGRYQGFIGE